MIFLRKIYWVTIWLKMIQQYKIILIGDSAVGKTTYLKLLCNNYFEKKYVTTFDKEIYSFNYKDAIFNFWDCSGNTNLGGYNMSYYNNSDAYIIMYTERSKIRILERFANYMREKYPNMPIIFVKNKVDNLERSFGETINISCKNNHNIYAPINKLYSTLKN